MTLAPTISRVGVPVYIRGEHVGTVVVDSRQGLSASACRLCDSAIYDRPPAVAARWLIEHLPSAHGTQVIGTADLAGLEAQVVERTFERGAA